MTKWLVASVFVALLGLAWLLFARWGRDTSVGADVSAPAAEANDEGLRPELALALEDHSLESISKPRVEAIATSVAPIESIEPQTVEPAPNETLDPGMRRIVGRVIDVDRHEPVTGCRVEFLQDLRSSKRLVTDSAGRFESPAMFEPGTVSVMNLPAMEGVDAHMQWTIQPGRFTIDDASDPKQPFEIELIATPRARIVFEVRGAYGMPAKDAFVCASSIVRPERLVDRGTETQLGVSTILSCDDQGRSTIWVSREFAAACALSLRALGVEGVAAVATIEPPLPTTPIVLVFELSSYLHIRVVDARGEPVSGAAVELTELTDASGAIMRPETANTAGVVTFAGVPPGRFELVAADPPTRRSSQQQIELTSGQNVDLEMKLPDADVRLALRGVVLDEAGEPLPGVDVAVIAPSEDQRARSGDDGAFEAWMLPCDELNVEVGARELDDVFEPAQSRVAFGTTDFVVRRVRALERTKLVIRLVDKQTRRTIRSARVCTARHSYGEFTSWVPRDGLTRVTVSDREDAVILFAARGYKSVQRLTRELLPPLEQSDIVTIELTPGFERIVTFVDSETHVKLAGVAMIQPSGAMQRSDAEGNVALMAREWPPPYRVVLDGYRTIDWDPNDAPDWKRVIQLEKLVR